MAQWLDRVKFGSGKNGSPAVSGTINSYAACTGTATQLSLTTALSASAGDVILIHQSQGTGAGQWEINYVLADAGATLTLAYPLAYTYGTGAQVVLIPQYTGGTLSGTVTGPAWNGSTGGIIALMSNGDLTVSGTISATSIGFRGASGVGPGAGIDGRRGESYNGEWNSKTYLANYSGGGGCDYNANQAGHGGGGGNGTSGATGANTGNAIQGIGGGTSGNAELTSSFFGGGGGGASTGNDGSSYSVASGNGAGIILIFAKKITVSGSITATGQNGPGSTYQSGNGGAGAGGSILMKCENADIGTNKITASGGIGGQSGTGGNGGAGRIRVEYAGSINGTATPSASIAQVAILKSQVYGGMI